MTETLNIGVLALQGAFAEHKLVIERIDGGLGRYRAREVRSADDLETCTALILPGGESTAMRIIAAEDKSGLFQALKVRVKMGMPVFGTCAGCILLSDRVSSSLRGGDNTKVAHLEGLEGMAVYGEQHIGGLDVDTCRNFFGRQTRSFKAPAKSESECLKNFPCVFIRAPAIAHVGDNASVLARVVHDGEDIIVAVRQGNLLGTCFHPELSGDDRVHEYFLSIVDDYIRLSK